MLLQGVATVTFFILVWAAGTVTQYRYWQKVRKLIHERAQDHVGYLGTGMCKISFSRKSFVMILTDLESTITGCFELKGLSLSPRFVEIPGMVGTPLDSVFERLPNEKYHDAFQQSVHAIRSSM